MDQFLHALPIFAAATLTPLAMYFFGRMWPPRRVGEFRRERLKAQYGWIDTVAMLLCMASAVAPLSLLNLMSSNTDPIGIWIIGLQFGSMVIVPSLWVALATLPFGVHRFRDFWLFYEVRWGVGMRGWCIICLPLGILGVVSAVRLWIEFA